MNTLITAVAAGPFAVGWPLHAWRLRRRIDAARRDPLTGLWTREPFETHARRSLALGPSAVVLVDLNDFKQVNDTFGHAAGDALIAATGRRLASWTADNAGTAARLGGDEFAAVICCYSAEDLHWAMGDLLTQLGEPVAFEGRELRPWAAAGVAWSDPYAGPVDLPRVLRLADEAMYAAKPEGHGWTLAHHTSPRMATFNNRRAGRSGTARPVGGER